MYNVKATSLVLQINVLEVILDAIILCEAEIPVN